MFKNLLKLPLLPFTFLYGLITKVRNLLYDKGYFKTYQPTKPRLINVGNLTVGGTGKTPHVEMLIRYFSDTYKLATLSRGYGRKTKGFRIAQGDDTPATLGDEPFQLYEKFKKQALKAVTVGEKRANAIQQIEKTLPEIDIVLLDDAFQHRAIKAHCNILVTDFGRLFYKDVPFPAGRLREGRQGAKRADVVIVSKCPPDLPAQKQQEIQNQIAQYTQPNTPIFFTALRYSTQKPLSPTENNLASLDTAPFPAITLLTGIAHTKPLLTYIATKGLIGQHLNFPDHHYYTWADLEKISHQTILTTEKDWVKLSQPDLLPFWNGRQVYVILIEAYFLNQEADFWQFITQRIFDTR